MHALEVTVLILKTFGEEGVPVGLFVFVGSSVSLRRFVGLFSDRLVGRYDTGLPRVAEHIIYLSDCPMDCPI